MFLFENEGSSSICDQELQEVMLESPRTLQLALLIYKNRTTQVEVCLKEKGRMSLTQEGLPLLEPLLKVLFASDHFL